MKPNTCSICGALFFGTHCTVCGWFLTPDETKIVVYKCMACPEKDRFIVPAGSILGFLVMLTHIEYVHPKEWAWLQGSLPEHLR
jgi:hypothetical protein